MQVFRLAFVRARNRATFPLPSDELWDEVVMTGPDSIVGYWRDTLGPGFDLQVREYDWVDSTPVDGGAQSQADAAIAAVRATKPLDDPITEHDGFFVFTYPGLFQKDDGAGGTITYNGFGQKVVVDGVVGAAVPVSGGNITFATHEMGHALGFGHTFGFDGPTPTEYGSPYDIMSAFNFGGAGDPGPTYKLTKTPGWTYDEHRDYQGPHLSRAYLHATYPAALDGLLSVRHELTGADTTGTQRLRAVGSNGQGTVLLILDPPGAGASVRPPGRTYIELRVAQGWDQGLDAAPDAPAATGLVVHTLDAFGRTGYRGRIAPDALDDDLQVGGTPVTIRLSDHDLQDPAGAWADVSWTTTPVPVSVWLDVSKEESVVGGSPTLSRATPCGDVVEWGTWTTVTTMTFAVRTLGVGGTDSNAQLNLDWSVGTTALSGQSGYLPVATAALGAMLEWQRDAVTGTLTLTSPAGADLSMMVSAMVTPPTGLPYSAEAAFTARGRYEGYQPAEQRAVEKCLVRVEKRLPAGWPQPRIPDPSGATTVRRWYEAAIRSLDDLLRHPGVDRRAVDAARSLIDLQLPPRR